MDLSDWMRGHKMRHTTLNRKPSILPGIYGDYVVRVGRADFQVMPGGWTVTVTRRGDLDRDPALDLFLSWYRVTGDPADTVPVRQVRAAWRLAHMDVRTRPHSDVDPLVVLAGEGAVRDGDVVRGLVDGDELHDEAVDLIAEVFQLSPTNQARRTHASAHAGRPGGGLPAGLV